jgi:N-acetylglucosaminyldiphosphoundecaprenol N-acetyl-beta-D-mannosaminyltransferase
VRPDPDPDATRLDSRRVVSVRVDASSYDSASHQVTDWAEARESRYVCVCNVHMVMEAHDDPTFQTVVNKADLVVPDGMPLVWALRWLGVSGASRVYGPHLMLRILERAQTKGIPVGLHGGDPETLEALVHVLEARFPELSVPYRRTPPFGPASFSKEVVREVQAAGARILFVALGCPKQERWMHLHRGALPAVMVGVGAAFDFIAGRKRQAPAFLQRAGLEWTFRLATEPRRLWRRYALHNPRFVALMARELMVRSGPIKPPKG